MRQAIKVGRYRDTRHSRERGTDRNIDLLDVIEILESGFHESRKDLFREDFQSWNYAIRGKTFEGRDLRIIVYFDGNLVMIATVIDLS